MLDKYLSAYDDLLIVEDLNSEVTEGAMDEFCKNYRIKNFIKGPTCFKNPEKPSSIDVMLTNRPKST